MVTEPLAHNVDSIGIVAGQVWEHLNTAGPLTLSKLARDMDAPRDLVMQAVGWLAREDKVVFNEGKRSKTVALKS